MRKIYDKTSLFSKIINRSFVLTNDKKISSSASETKKYIDKNSGNQPYELPKRFNMKKEKFDKMPVYSYNGEMSTKNDRKILYIHGGSFIEEARYFQIKFAVNIAEKTNSNLIFPIYPLLPENNCKKMHDLIEYLYDTILDDSQEIIFLGDSAGGGFLLSFAMYLRNKGKKLPNHIIMMSPWLDLSLSNPNIYEDAKKDYMCGVDGTKYAGKLWAGDLNIKDPLVSPMFGNFDNLPEMTIITGGSEILNSDCHKLDEELTKQNIKHNFIEYANQGHDFGAYPTLEGRMLIDDIANIINGIEV